MDCREEVLGFLLKVEDDGSLAIAIVGQLLHAAFARGKDRHFAGGKEAYETEKEENADNFKPECIHVP